MQRHTRLDQLTDKNYNISFHSLIKYIYCVRCTNPYNRIRGVSRNALYKCTILTYFTCYYITHKLMHSLSITAILSHHSIIINKEMATYRHWSVSLWRDPDDVSHCQILSSDKTEWQLISATRCLWHAYEKKNINYVHGTNFHHRFVAFTHLILLNVNLINFYTITLLTYIVRRP